ncbi:MAG: ATP-binding protein [Candidatus Peribacteraceae bacterium]|nr:ATP-binding protein [Candidatus Peribacteraceae bacterium]
MERTRKALNISSFDSTFGNFRPVAGTEKSLAAFQELVNESTRKMLLCIGSKGCGKTHLCEALSLSWWELGFKVRIYVWSDFIGLLKSTFSGEMQGQFDVILTRFKKAPRLILDDVGMGGATDKSWEWGVLEEIINYRYRERLITVVTTNLDITELPDRVVSRFRDEQYGRVVLNKADDYRPRRSKG